MGKHAHYFVGKNGYSQVAAMLIIKRKSEYHIFNTFLQTFLLHCIGVLTFLFDLHNFSDRIIVTLTTMLVVVTLTTSIQEVSQNLYKIIMNKVFLSYPAIMIQLYSIYMFNIINKFS